MDILTIDFETYYDKDYSLKNMTVVEYIHDPRFEVIMMCYAWNDEEPRSLVGADNVRAFFDTIDWSKTILNAQNVQFDGSIVRMRFGHIAQYYTDTMAMARVTGAHVFYGASLDAISRVMQEAGVKIPNKGKEVHNARGMHLYFTGTLNLPYLAERPINNDIESLQQAMERFEAYEDYCKLDVLIAQKAFGYFSSMVTPQEMQYGDMIAKCYIKPQLFIDLPTVEQEIERIKLRDAQRVTDVANRYFGGDEELLRRTMRSAQRFTEFLRTIGGYYPKEPLDPVRPFRFYIPMKYSEKKDTTAPCYSKTHIPVVEILEGDDEELRTLFELKLAMTSSIERTRAERFRNIALTGEMFGLPYTVSGAISHRLGGAGGLNVQNLPSGRKAGQSTALRDAIVAPQGHKIVVYDSSQIELRTGYYIADDQENLDLFRQGKDPYSVQASLIYGGDPNEIKKLAKQGVEPYSNIQRPVGKSSLLSCIYGTGAVGFMNYAKMNGVDLSLDSARSIVKIYRDTHPKVVAMWQACEVALGAMLAGDEGYFGGSDGRLFYYTGNRYIHGRRVPGVRLPDGNWLNYANLRIEMRAGLDGVERPNYAYTGVEQGKLRTFYIYPAKLYQNCNQALAYAVMKYQALEINKQYPIVLNTHDEWGAVVHDSLVPNATKYMEHCMMTPPPWAVGLPLSCEGNSAQRYGDT